MGERRKKENILRVFSAGGVVFKKEDNKTYFLLIKPAKTDRWQFPKGLIDKGESTLETALREVEEEGGVKAEVVKKLGASSYFFVWEGEKIFKTVTYFLMKYLKDTGDGHDGEVEKVLFAPFAEAYEKLTYKDDKNFLKKAKEILERGIQNHLMR